MTMTLPMAIRVVSSTAKVGFVFARRGVVMEAASSFFLPRLIGLSNAMCAQDPLHLAVEWTILE